MMVVCKTTQGIHIDEKLIEEADKTYNDFTIHELKERVKAKNFKLNSVIGGSSSAEKKDLISIIALLEKRVEKIS